jgi:methionyl-tRNA formyltransferase
MPSLRSTQAPVTGRVVFVGAVHEALPALDVLTSSPVAHVTLLVTSPQEHQGALSGAVDMVGPARAAGIPVLRAADINAPDVVATIRDTAPDLLVVVGWTRLIGSPLLAVPRRGCVGFHASMLPAFRGRAPVNWAILRGEKTTGNTMMLLDPGTDTGDIVDRRAVRIWPDDTCATVYDRIARVGADMLDEHLLSLLGGTAPRTPQPADGGEVLSKRTPEMGVIDWSRTAAELHDWVRALTAPYPGAFTSIAGRRVMVWRSQTPGGRETAADPGTVLGFEPGGVRVATGHGDLLLTEMSEPDEPPGPAGYWSRTASVSSGDRFDLVSPEVSRWTLGLGPRPAEVYT